MLKEHQKFIDKASILAGGIIIFLSFYLWYLFIDCWLGAKASKYGEFDEYVVIISVFAGIVMFVMRIREFSISSRFISLSNILKELFICYTLGVLGMGFVTYTFKIPHFSRLYTYGSILFSYGTLSFFYSLQSLLYKEMRIRGYNIQNILLVGNKYTLPQILQTIKNNKALGLHISRSTRKA